MSDISPENILSLLEQARSKAIVLEQNLENVKEQLSLCKGEIQAYEHLLQGLSISGSSQLLANTNKDLHPATNYQPNIGIGNTLGNIGNGTTVQPVGHNMKKKRAARATKAEMEHRKKVIVRILKQKGDMTPKDLNPIVDEALGKPLERHHLRAVLRRFTEIFEAKKDHGFWGLTLQGRTYYEDITEEEDTSEESS